MKKILLLVVILAAHSYAAEPNLVAWWQFDEGTGTIAYDSAGDNKGNLINGPVWTSGRINGGLNFDGVDDYVRVPDNLSLKFGESDSFSICMSVNPVTGGHLISKLRAQVQYAVFGYEVAMDWSNRRFYFYVQAAMGGGDAAYTPVNSVSPETWYHLACVYQNRDMYIYLNGIPCGSGHFRFNTLSASDADMTIGVRSYDTTLESYFGGTIDDIRIYNRNLSAEEIWQIFYSVQAKSLRPYPTDGMACLPQNTVLSWWPGKDAVSHDVYLGTDFNEVNEANISDTSGIYRGRQDANYYDPCGLERGLTYYWRVDEVNDANINSPWRGDIWSFAALGLGPPLQPTTLTYPLSDSNNGRYQVKWSASTCATFYKLARSADAGITWTLIYNGPGTTYCDDVNTGNYRYRVCASNDFGDSEWNTGSTDCSVVLCFPTSEPNMSNWKLLGKPRCWCFQRQCKGDTNGTIEGGATKSGYYRVGVSDLSTFVRVYLVKEQIFDAGLKGEPNICACLKHYREGNSKSGYYWVGPVDLTIFTKSYLVKEPTFGSGIGTCPAGASGSRYTLPTDNKPCN